MCDPDSPVARDQLRVALESIRQSLAAIDNHRRAFKRNPESLGNAILLGSLGYWAFDNLVLWACFRGFGVHVALTVVLMGYLIGQLGGLLPIPGGLGGVEGVGTLVVYGVSLRDAVAAVLAYRVIQFWIPLLLSLPAFVSLQRGLNRPERPDLCAPAVPI